MKHIITEEPVKTSIIAHEMKIGQIGRVTEGHHEGNHVVRLYGDTFMALERPLSTWDAYCALQVEVLPVGTVLTLTVGDAK